MKNDNELKSEDEVKQEIYNNVLSMTGENILSKTKIKELVEQGVTLAEFKSNVIKESIKKAIDLSYNAGIKSVYKTGVFITNGTSKDIRVFETEAISEDEAEIIELNIIKKDCGTKVYPSHNWIVIEELETK